MAVWSVTEPYLSVRLTDTPLTYRPSKGRDMGFMLHYSDDPGQTLGIDAGQSMIFGVGTNWSTPWRSYVHPISGSPNRAYVVNGDGSMRVYNMSGDTVSARDFTTLSTLQHQSEVFSPAQPERYLLTLHDGTVHYYESAQIFPDALGNDKTIFFLSQIVEPNGALTTFNYSRGLSDELLLDSIVDTDGNEIFFDYVSKGPYAALVSQVSGPFGLTSTLAYDNNGFLTNITDCVGLWSAMTYNASNRLAMLQTPYGTNSFAYIYPATGEWSALKVTELNVRKHFWVCGNLPDTLAIIPQASDDHTALVGKVADIPGYGSETFDYQNLHRHNSVYWGPRQYDNLPGALRTKIENSTFTTTDLTTNHVNISFYKHYLQQATANYVSYTVSVEKEPSGDAGGGTTGNVIYYDYPSKPSGHRDATGTVQWPKCQAHRTSGSDWSISYWEYDSAGMATKKIGNYTADAGGTEGFRTETYAYTNLTHLSEHRFWLDDTTSHLVRSNLWSAQGQPLVTWHGEDQAPTYYAYDNNNYRLTNTISPTGLMTEHQYDVNGYPSKNLDYSGSVSPVALRTNQFTYTNGRLVSSTDERNLVTTYTYDNLGRLLTMRYPSDNTGVTNIYNKLDLAVVRDRLGFTNQYAYNGFRERVTWTNANFRVTTYGYNCNCGALTDVTDPLGNVTHYDYDNAGRKTRTTLPTGGGWIENTYNEAGQVTAVTDNFGRVISRTYNHQGLLVDESDASGSLRTTFFDVEDNAYQTTDPSGVTVTQSFDSLHRILTRSYADGGIEKFGYSSKGLTGYTNAVQTNTYVLDVYGRRKQESIIPNPSTSWVTTNDYSPAGDLITLADPRNKKTTWVYDSFGRMTQKKDHAGATVFTYGYDSNGRMTTRTAPASTGGGTITTTYSYDPAGNVLTVVYPSSPTLTFKYDANNRMTNMVDAAGTSAFAYTGYGTLLSENGPWASDTVSYAYNSARLRTGLVLSQPNGPDWSQSYTYDTSERLQSISTPSGAFSYTYHADHRSRVEKIALPSGNWITNDYDSVARLTRTHLTAANGYLTNKHEYAYNQGGQRTSQTRGDAITTNNNQVSYSYDGQGQLVTASGTESSGTVVRTNEQFGYLYDAAGNLASRTNGVAASANKLVQSFTVNDLNQLSTGSRSGTLTVGGWASGSPTISVTVQDNLNAVAAATVYKDNTFARSGIAILNGNNTFIASETDGLGRTDSHTSTVSLPSSLTYRYDARGNLTNDGNRALFYNEENQLTAVQVNTKWRSEFTYDGKMRLRIRKEYKANGASWTLTNECRYVYDGNLAIQERDANNTPVVSYTRGKDLSGTLQGAGGIGGLLARTDHSAGSHAYYHADGNGNITALVNEKSAIVARYSYDPFGNILAAQGPLAEANLYRFSSKEAHLNSGLVYYLYRFYDPNLQRWPNRDPIGEKGGINLYAFIKNIVTSLYDPWGLTFPGTGSGAYPPYRQPPPFEGPIDCGSRIAEEERNRPAPGPDPSSRYTHCVVSCRISKECIGGRLTAWLAGDWYQDPWWESQSDTGSDPGDRRANKEGRDISCKKDKSCAEGCADALKAGSLYPTTWPIYPQPIHPFF